MYHDSSGNTFMVEDEAVNSIDKRRELETRVHKSLVRGAIVPAAVAAVATASPSSRPYRPRRRMSLHRGTAGMVPAMTMAEGGGGNDLNKSEVAAIMSARLEGGESDIIELPTINATVVQRSGGGVGQ